MHRRKVRVPTTMGNTEHGWTGAENCSEENLLKMQKDIHKKKRLLRSPAMVLQPSSSDRPGTRKPNMAQADTHMGQEDAEGVDRQTSKHKIF